MLVLLTRSLASILKLTGAKELLLEPPQNPADDVPTTPRHCLLFSVVPSNVVLSPATEDEVAPPAPAQPIDQPPVSGKTFAMAAMFVTHGSGLLSHMTNNSERLRTYVIHCSTSMVGLYWKMVYFIPFKSAIPLCALFERWRLKEIGLILSGRKAEVKLRFHLSAWMAVPTSAIALTTPRCRLSPSDVPPNPAWYLLMPDPVPAPVEELEPAQGPGKKRPCDALPAKVQCIVVFTETCCQRNRPSLLRAGTCPPRRPTVHLWASVLCLQFRQT